MGTHTGKPSVLGVEPFKNLQASEFCGELDSSAEFPASFLQANSCLTGYAGSGFSLYTTISTSFALIKIGSLQVILNV